MTISQVEEGNDSHFHVSIPELTPLIANQSSRSIKAVVTLVWPYSSATKTVALLLAEPDFRLRRKRGQVRTQFQGSIAEAVATSGIGSGDEIVLSLEGAEFVHNAENIVGTPGRGVDFELKYTHRLVLKAIRESTPLLDLDLEYAPAIEVDEISPRLSTTLEIESPIVEDSDEKRVSKGQTQWKSPAFGRLPVDRFNVSLRPEYDPFAEDDGFVLGKGRKRTRFSRQSGEWTLTDRTPSPEADDDDADVQSTESPTRAPRLMEGQLSEEALPNPGHEESSQPATVERIEIHPLIPRDQSRQAAPTSLPTHRGSTPLQDFAQTTSLPALVDKSLLDGHVESRNQQIPQDSRLRLLSPGHVLATMTQESQEISPTSLMGPLQPLNESFDTIDSHHGQSTMHGLLMADGMDILRDHLPDQRYMNVDSNTRELVHSRSSQDQIRELQEIAFPEYHAQEIKYPDIVPLRKRKAETKQPAVIAGDVVEQETVEKFKEDVHAKVSPASESESILDEHPSEDDDQVESTDEGQSPEVQEKSEMSYGSVDEGELSKKVEEEEEEEEEAEEVVIPAKPGFEDRNEMSDESVDEEEQEMQVDEQEEEVEVDDDDEDEEEGDGEEDEEEDEEEEEEEEVTFVKPSIAEVIEISSDESASESDSDEGESETNGQTPSLSASPRSRAQQTNPTPFQSSQNSESHPLHYLQRTIEAERTTIGDQPVTPQPSQISIPVDDIRRASVSTPMLIAQRSSELLLQLQQLTPADSQPLAQFLPTDSANDTPSKDGSRTRAEHDQPQLARKRNVRGKLIKPAEDGEENTSPTPDDRVSIDSVRASDPEKPFQAAESEQTISQNVDTLRDVQSTPAKELSSPYQLHGNSTQDQPEEPSVISRRLRSRTKDPSPIPAEHHSKQAQSPKELFVPGSPIPGPVTPLPQPTGQVAAEISPVALAASNRGLETAHSNFVGLKYLDSHFNSTIDVLGIVSSSTEIQRAARGQKDHFILFRITSPALLAVSALKDVGVEIYRPYKDALPHVEQGNGILLRNLQVQGKNRKMILKSSSVSAWVVFGDHGEDIRGPPVEYGDQEREHVKELRNWWTGIPDKFREKVKRKEEKESDTSARGTENALTIPARQTRSSVKAVGGLEVKELS